MQRVNQIASRLNRVTLTSGSVYVLMLLLFWTSAAATGAEQSTTKFDSDSITKLISQLDSRSYSVRETAMKQLSLAGEAALRPLALKLLDGTPESNWRIKKAIESIGTRGNKDTYLKAMGILEIFIGATPELLDLENKWKQEQQRIAIRSLTDAGAVVKLPKTNQRPDQMQQIMFLTGRNMPSTEPAAKPPPPPVIKPTAARKRIESILENDTEANSKLIFGNRAKQALAKRPKSNEQIFAQQLGLRDEIIIINGRAVSGFNTLPKGVSVIFGPEWKGNQSDLETLTKIDNLNKVVLQNQRLDQFELEVLTSNSAITSLELDDCQLSTIQIEKLLNDSAITELTFSNQRIPRAYMTKIAAAKRINSIEFKKCDLSPAAFDTLRDIQTLVEVRMSEITLDDEFFESATQLKNLRSIALSACEYDRIRAAQLSAVRPNIRITYPAQAYLGVRGTQGGFEEGVGCSISEVIPNSGAARGGIEVGDIVRKIDGNPIRDFEHLRRHVAHHKNGDVLMVQVERNGKNKTLKVQLGHIDDAPDN